MKLNGPQSILSLVFLFALIITVMLREKEADLKLMGLAIPALLTVIMSAKQPEQPEQPAESGDE